VTENRNEGSADRLARTGVVASIVLSVVSVGVAYWSVKVSQEGVEVAQKGTPDWYAAPSDLRCFYTEGNVLTKDGKPKSGFLTIKIENTGVTPARNVRVQVTPISDKPKITSEQEIESQDAPLNSRIVTIDRIPPNEIAVVDILDTVTEYPLYGYSNLGNARFKYQYFPVIQKVQTEFGLVECALELCGRQLLRLEDDGGGADQVVPPVLLREAMKALREQESMPLHN